jgi:hypothetical protein
VTALLLALLLLDSPAGARVPPPWTAEAIRAGSTPEKFPAYTVPELAIEFTTPYLRVARAANKAFREHKVLRPDEVDPRAWVPELRVAVGPRPASGKGAAGALPKSARLILGAGEARAKRMEADVLGLRAVFEVTGGAPAGGELEIRYAAPGGKEILERVPLDFRKTRW